MSFEETAVLETLLDFARRDNLAGWIPGQAGVGAKRRLLPKTVAKV
jgi:hypothetical protein